MTQKATTGKPHDAETAVSGAQAVPTCVAAWLVPGMGHFLLGRRVRGLIFLAVITVTFASGLFMQGELFALERSRPLDFLAGLAEIGVGLPYFVAQMTGLGAGDVRSVTYEYGYTFCIVAGLLNLLVVLDAFDIAVGRKD